MVDDAAVRIARAVDDDGFRAAHGPVEFSLVQAVVFRGGSANVTDAQPARAGEPRIKEVARIEQDDRLSWIDEAFKRVRQGLGRAVANEDFFFGIVNDPGVGVYFSGDGVQGRRISKAGRICAQR